MIQHFVQSSQMIFPSLEMQISWKKYFTLRVHQTRTQSVNIRNQNNKKWQQGFVVYSLSSHHDWFAIFDKFTALNGKYIDHYVAINQIILNRLKANKFPGKHYQLEVLLLI